MLLLWLVYALPFIHIIPYLWFDFDHDNPLLLWGLVVNPYMVDKPIIMLTAMIGAVGGLGFAVGISLNNKKIVIDAGRISGEHTRKVKALSTPVWITWVIVAVALSWMAAPQETIFTAVYTASESLLENADFSSAKIISYALLSFALCDAILDLNPVRKRFKQRVIFCAIAFVVAFLQFLRGDRESVPLVFGALLVYYYWAAPITQRGRKNLPTVMIIVGAFGLVVVTSVLGVMRSLLVDVNSLTGIATIFDELVTTDVISVSNLLHGTWSGALMSPLSVAGDYINGLLPLKYGRDYLNLLLSIPPGFIADAVGYTRPWTPLTGPAWEMRYGLGGTHAVVLPFMNFRMIGVFVIPASWAFGFTIVEKIALKRLTVLNLAFLCTVVTVSPHWLWYGEKNVVNVLIIWYLLSLLYRFSLSLRSWKQHVASAQTVSAIR